MPLRLSVLALLVALLSAAAPARAQEGVPDVLAVELPKQPLAAVRVEGNRRVDPEAILREIETKPGEVLTREALRRDVKTLFEMGFFSDVAVRLLTAAEAGADGPVVVFQVVEKPAIREIRYEGLEHLSKDDVKELVKVTPFSILDRSVIEKSARAIADKYREKGYYLAEVTYRLDPVPAEASVDVVFVVNEQAKVEVRQVRFVGNDHIPSKDLAGVMETREGGYFSFLTGSGTYKEDAFDRDLMRISAVYYDRGYINVKVSRPLVTLSPDRQSLFVTVPIEEGEQYHVGKMDLSGDLIADKDALMARLTLKDGELFVRSKLGADITGLQDLYRNRGYAYVNVTPLTNIDPKKRTIDLTLDISKGDRVHIEQIEIRGNTRTRDKVIRREMRIAEGDLYNGTAIDVSKQRITALGYFENVEIATKPGSGPDKIDLEVTVKERPTGTFQVGAGVSSGEGLIATAQISHDNLFGRGQSLSLMFQYSSLRTIFQLQFMDPYFLDTNWTLAFSAFNTRADYFTFISNRTGGSLTGGYQLLPDLRLFATYTLENVSEEYDTPIPVGLSTGGLTSALQLSLSYDTRDNRLFPTRGQYQTVSVEHAPEWLGSQNRFTRYNLTSRFYQPLPFGAVGRLKVELGYITGPQFPFSERYYLGGVYDLRGYLLRSISPTVMFPASDAPDAATRPFAVGGNKEFLTNLEIEFPLLPPIGLRGVVFYDMGNAFSESSAFFQDPQHDLPLGLFHSVGFGVRWFSPIGPLRFEWGIPLTPRPGDEPIRFEFTVGNFF